MPNKRWTVDELARACISHCPHELQVDAGEEHDCIWHECARAIRRGGTEAPSTSEVDLEAVRKLAATQLSKFASLEEFLSFAIQAQFKLIQLADEVEKERSCAIALNNACKRHEQENANLREVTKRAAETDARRTYETCPADNYGDCPEICKQEKRCRYPSETEKILRAALAGEEVSGG
jgi:hypothetical protein